MRVHGTDGFVVKEIFPLYISRKLCKSFHGIMSKNIFSPLNLSVKQSSGGLDIQVSLSEIVH